MGLPWQPLFDRDPEWVAQIRAVLEAGGVPEHHLDWMANSCPSVRAAEEYIASEKARVR